MDQCPDPSVWVAWERGGLWDAHLESCPACRAELAALAEAGERRSLPFLKVAAGFLLVIGLAVWHFSRGPVTIPTALPPASSAPASWTEWMVGATGEVSLAPGARGRLEGAVLLLEHGEARVETSLDPIRVSLEGWRFEILDGEAVFRASPEALSLWMGSAWAAEAPPVTVIRGEVLVLGEGRVLKPVPGVWVPDPRGWKSLDGGAWRDGEKVLLPEASRFTAELLVRKKSPNAEAFLLFRSEDRGWQAPLGAYLPTSGAWVRVRLEVGERIRVLAAGREYFSAAPAGIQAKAYPWAGAGAFGLRAFGGDLEIREARWR